MSALGSESVKFADIGFQVLRRAAVGQTGSTHQPGRRRPFVELRMPQVSRDAEITPVLDWLQEERNCWIAIARAFLQRNERDIAVAKLTDALRYQLRDGPPSADTLGGRLFRGGANQIDYHAVAIQIAQAAEATDHRYNTKSAMSA